MNETLGILSVVIPFYNEEKTIGNLVGTVLESPFTGEIILVDDASTDQSLKIVQSLMDPRIKIIKHEKNLGKGSAIRTGFAKVSRRYVVIQDADLEYSPTEYGTLLKPLIEGKADVVFGSRFQSSGERRVLYFWHRLGNSLLTLFSNLLTNLDLTDMETCYKVMTKEVAMALDIQENRFGLEPELTAKVASLNLRIFEVPISYNGRTYEEGKKITWRDGFSAIRCIIKYNSPRTKSKTRARYGLILNSLPMTE